MVNNSQELDDQIKEARELLSRPEYKIVREIAFKIIERLNREILAIKPSNENLLELNEKYGRRSQLCELFMAIETLGNKETYKTNMEQEVEDALQKSST